MERMWVFTGLVVAVSLVDFLDPALGAAPDARERGVRVEVRPAGSSRSGSVYASDPLSIGAALCRIDLLESSPGAADRMHWHPDMRDGEPGDRTFDPTMPSDPVGWLSSLLDHGLEDVLARRAPLTPGADDDLRAVRAVSHDICHVVSTELARARQPWPVVTHDERGLAVSV